MKVTSHFSDVSICNFFFYYQAKTLKNFMTFSVCLFTILYNDISYNITYILYNVNEAEQ